MVKDNIRDIERSEEEWWEYGKYIAMGLICAGIAIAAARIIFHF